VTAGRLEYNAFTGRLTLSDVSARDAGAREIFHAERVLATVNPLGVLAGTLALGRVRVDAPRLTLRTTDGLDFDGVSGVLLGTAGPLALPLRADDLVIGGGTVTVEGAGERGAPLVVRDLDLRLGRLTTARADARDVAFAVEMAVYGTTVHVTGQPRGGGYVVHLRAKGLDAAALARDFRMAGLDGIQRGEAEIDADLVLAEGRVLASGFVRLTEAVMTLPLAGRPRLRAASVAVAADAFDLATGAGRITRLDLATPSLALPAAGGGAALSALLAVLRDDSDLVVRRISIADGTLALDGPAGVRLSRLQLAARLPERRAEGWVVRARAVLGGDAEVSVDGLVSRDLRRLDAVTRLVNVPIAPWRALAGATPGWDGRVSFDGRLRLAASEGDIVATATGQAEIRDVRGSAAGGFHAERVALGIRQLRWPSREAVFDRVVVTRPAFGLAALGPWTDSLVTGEISVVDGEVRAQAPGHALHQVTAAFAPDDAGDGLVRLRVSAATESGARVSLDRVVASSTTEPGLPLSLLAATLDEAARSAPVAVPTPFPSALPALP
jgi:hypothetical protein